MEMNAEVKESVGSALILEGGAMRGLFTCGVIDTFLEENIFFDAVAGISAGAVFGCNYISRQIGRALRYNINYGQDPRYCSLRNLFRTGDLYDVNFCYHEIPERLDPFDTDTFSANPTDFYVGATNVDTGRIEFHKCSNGKDADIEWMRASASMPVVSRPVEIDGKRYLDGGIVDSVPYGYMEELGYRHNVIILTQPNSYVKQKSRAQGLMNRMLRKYPKIAKAMSERHLMYARQMAEIEERRQKKEALVIRPAESLGISRTESDPNVLQRVYDLGRAEGKKRLEEVREFLKK